MHTHKACLTDKRQSPKHTKGYPNTKSETETTTIYAFKNINNAEMENIGKQSE
jgi:hypothetical protein